MQTEEINTITEGVASLDLNDQQPYTNTQYCHEQEIINQIDETTPFNSTQLDQEDSDQLDNEETADIEEIKKHFPTTEQIHTAIKNCKIIYDPRNQMPEKQLFEMLDNGCLQSGKITLMSFVINTCEFIMSQYDIDEGLKVTALVSEFVRDSKDLEKQQLLSCRIFNAICCPVPLYENAAFMQIWADIMQLSFEYKDALVYAELNQSGYFQTDNQLSNHDEIEQTTETAESNEGGKTVQLQETAELET